MPKRSKSRIQIGKEVTVKGKKFVIRAGKIQGKKYTAVPADGKGGAIHFGQSGAFSYCARSAGIKTSKKGASANDFARLLWNCNGKKSMKR